ncbi:MAG: nucleotide exchange factor GrpE [Lentimicrobiaceae bacterium]|jgi:molecular chaperone GrpE|nr:nucleotide exchange factor GrpE [Lentimicrobiaceae bacterium]
MKDSENEINNELYNSENELEMSKKNSKKEEKQHLDEEQIFESQPTDLTLEEKYNELNDKYLRLFSEFDNFRKRTARERIEESKTASENIIMSLLPIIDDMERALQTMKENQIPEADLEGLRLIYNKLMRTLQQRGLEEIQSLHQEFDTDKHEALTNIPVEDEDMKGKVVDVVQKGYTLNGKVIRFARVIVGV